ncbi:peptidyl-prolyl cis-trans isomerase [Aurantiacibacter sp. MUD11]|uniref:peptidyl-prolyl cis-trans isomerase n=1 Tax=Aurantiacibacter sp. MUD11 TaxID=3003265 RepID=UPI0022AABF5D|nr:peptidyl-prolyl cis-trans isomerase [Aurantiacibacter sp. MUD11]WAT17732.1 peptidyl-prolyl cis-trans isomerase [Aurantiacibacter sp. MUD11]
MAGGRSILREPLLHFLLAGAAIFAVVAALQPEDTSGRQITVDRDDLLVFMQGRAQVYEEGTFAAMLEAMPAVEREQLVRDAALQEALYREGLALDIAAADPLIRQRVVQQMRMLVIEEAAADISVTDEEVAAHFEDNRALYALPPTVSFTHVFLRGNGAQRRAIAMRGQMLAGSQVPVGDRFPYQRAYVDADGELLASQFGATFAEAVLTLPEGEWSQPLQSQHGWHLVLPSEVSSGEDVAFEQVEARVREDALAAKRQALANAALEEFLGQYEITVADELR